MRYIVVIVAIAALVLGCTNMEDLIGNGHTNKRAGIPPMYDCQEHFNQCLGTRMQSIRDGNQGRCNSCYDRCRHPERWPDEIEGKDCRWWNY